MTCLTPDIVHLEQELVRIENPLIARITAVECVLVYHQSVESIGLQEWPEHSFVQIEDIGGRVRVGEGDRRLSGAVVHDIGHRLGPEALLIQSVITGERHIEECVVLSVDERLVRNVTDVSVDERHVFDVRQLLERVSTNSTQTLSTELNGPQVLHILSESVVRYFTNVCVSHLKKPEVRQFVDRLIERVVVVCQSRRTSNVDLSQCFTNVTAEDVFIQFGQTLNTVIKYLKLNSYEFSWLGYIQANALRYSL